MKQDKQNEQDEQAKSERQFLAERIEREIERRERERLFEEDNKIEDAQYDWWFQVLLCVLFVFCAVIVAILAWYLER